MRKAGSPGNRLARLSQPRAPTPPQPLVLWLPVLLRLSPPCLSPVCHYTEPTRIRQISSLPYCVCKVVFLVRERGPRLRGLGRGHWWTALLFPPYWTSFPNTLFDPSIVSQSFTHSLIRALHNDLMTTYYGKGDRAEVPAVLGVVMSERI